MTYECSSKKSLPGPVNDLVVELERHTSSDPDGPQFLKMPWDVAFPMEEELYAIMWAQSNGGWFRGIFRCTSKMIANDDDADANLGPNYTRLARFINNAMAAGKYVVRTVFGPQYSYFSMSPGMGYSWQNLAPELEEDIQNQFLTRQPVVVALGVQGAYVALYGDGTVTFKLRGRYPLVEALLQNKEVLSRRRGLAVSYSVQCCKA